MKPPRKRLRRRPLCVVVHLTCAPPFQTLTECGREAHLYGSRAVSAATFACLPDVAEGTQPRRCANCRVIWLRTRSPSAGASSP